MARGKNNTFQKLLTILGIVIVLEIIFVLAFLMKGKTIAILQPAGEIAAQQRDLIIFAAVLGLLVIVPVFTLLIYIVWRYRDGNVSAKYRPNWDGNKALEAIWWGLPLAIITILAVVTYQTSHSLDPYRALDNTKRPLRVQVVALQWKWLFIYPDYNIASVNQLQIPTDRPINFEITSDAPMNSFWIPQLGGQVYAMSGMTTKLHLIADKPGIYDGMSANISGEGFSGMKFSVIADSDDAFEQWHQQAHRSPDILSVATYEKLREPTKSEPVSLYSSIDQSVFDQTVMKYMGPLEPHQTNERHRY